MRRSLAPGLLCGWLLLAGCSALQGWELEPGPHVPAYEPYVADPRTSRIGISAMEAVDAKIEGTTSSRWRLQAGGEVGLLRWEKQESLLQLDGEAGFAGEFNLAEGNHNVGWDGTYGFLLSWQESPELAWRFGSLHVSSHVGDEFAELNEHLRINATREELLLGVSRMLAPSWRVYGESGWAYHLGNYDIMDRMRFQGGVEYDSPRTSWNGRLGWYTALDLSTYQEDDWNPNASLQWGFVIEGTSRLRPARVGLELYTGRARMGEFFEERETVLAIGLWL